MIKKVPCSRPATILLACVLLIAPAVAATTDLHIVHLGPDGKTVLAERTISFRWMETNLPVYGDGTTHYYLQGPVFVDDPDPVKEQDLRWNPVEDTNVQEKDMGAVKGTNLKDLCDLVGGMVPGEMIRVVAEDGFSKDFGYANVYSPPSRQGPIVLTWWVANEGIVPDYREGMRIVFFADNSTNPWGIHALGNADWRASADDRFWYFYRQGDEKYPTTTGLSVKYVSELQILPDPGATAPTTSPATGVPVDPMGGVIAVMIVAGYSLAGRRTQ